MGQAAVKRFVCNNARKAAIAALAFTLAQSSMSMHIGAVHAPRAVASTTPPCPTGSMNFQAGGTLSSATNTYYQPAAGTLAAGSTSVTLGTMDTGNGGATTAVSQGDELLIMQMQDGGNGSFNTSNTSLYGDGSGSGSGYTSIGNAGLYEYVFVSSVVGGVATVQGAGSGGGLINSYYENTANNQRYQIVRVPEYTTATLTSNFTAAYWDGKTGGVAALDISSTLNLGGASIYATGDGFRGGGVTTATTTPTAVLNNYYAASSTMNGAGKPGFGSKGEGILGTPNYVFYYTSFTTPSNPTTPTVTSSGANGYSGGDQGMGAPGNAGGGGTDDDPVSNDQNTGGGGGGNGGAGGKGGYPWTPQYSGNTSMYSALGLHTAASYSTSNSGDIGGRGGAALSASIGRAFMGGGGGAGANNNGSNNNTYNNYGSSGGTGGGVVLLRIANTSGSAATIYANGTTGLAPNNDGGGGGGAGGTVIITSPNAFTGITVYANGAAGTTADAAGSFPGNQHGPGGGGGGGIVLSSSFVSASVSGGTYGTTTPNSTSYGAAAGSSGYSSSVIDPTSIPGIGSGADCYSSTGSGTATMYTGPYDSGDATYNGAAYTGSYDGVQSATNNNDFTAREIPLPTPSPVPQNTGTSALSPIGNTFSVSSSPSVNVENALYYVNTAKANHTVTLTATAPVLPSQWSVQLCPDNGGTPNCGYGTQSTTCKSTNANQWMNISAAGSTATAQFCYRNGTNGASNPQILAYWAVYTGPTGTYTAFSRYDATIDAQDDQISPATPAENVTHNELYAGFVPIAKSSTVVTTGCPSGVSPPSGVCPSGVIRYSVQYANIVSGGGKGTEGQIAAAFPQTQAGSLVVSDDGLGGLNGTNWGTYTGGLVNALSAGTAGTNCGVYSSGWGACGDTTAGTTCTYDASHPSGVGATSFTCTIGGGSFQLYPSGFTGQTSSGTVTFAVQAK
ncbi:MAG TPA: hypothetical protein VFH72_02570 [Candidatus Baltobacteraceae bacterium]|nr:hypothetical protein [Candidatus Baltobacteraceae bacterium]